MEVKTTNDEEDDWVDDEVADTKATAVPAVLEIGLSKNISAEQLVAVSVLLPELETFERCPHDICCVIDVSGSMGTEATYEADGAQVTNVRFSVLDIVKHALKTVVHMLKDEDRLSIVAFSDDASMVCHLTHMTAQGKEEAIAGLETLRPEGATNLWAGMRTGMDTLREAAKGQVAHLKTLLVLTDGQPNEEPEGGSLAALKTYQESHPDFRFQMNTYGFGSAVDSELLLNISEAGNGTYAFIPDALIVGTVFVNSIANVLSTYTQTSTLHLMVKGGAEFTGPPLGFPQGAMTDASWGRVVELGPLPIGQARQLVLPMSIPPGDAPFLEVILEYSSPNGEKCKFSMESSGRAATSGATVAALTASVANAGVVAIEAMTSAQEEAAKQTMAETCNLFTSVPEDDERLQGLKKDAEGRMSKAVSTAERVHRWGKHYVRALVRAHQLQLCTNFMDPGLQFYGGKAYKSYREEGDRIFVSLPPPVAAPDEAGIPCDICRQMIPFSNYAEHMETCGRVRAPASRPAAQPTAPAREASGGMAEYYAGGGGG